MSLRKSTREKGVHIIFAKILAYVHIRNVPVLKYRNIHIVHDIHKIFTNQICVVGEILNLIIQSTLLQYYISLFVKVGWGEKLQKNHFLFYVHLLQMDCKYLKLPAKSKA